MRADGGHITNYAENAAANANRAFARSWLIVLYMNLKEQERTERIIEQNRNFICEICGKPDMVASQITIEANYGSINDGMRLTLNVCGDCIDSIISIIMREVD